MRTTLGFSRCVIHVSTITLSMWWFNFEDCVKTCIYLSSCLTWILFSCWTEGSLFSEEDCSDPFLCPCGRNKNHHLSSGSCRPWTILAQWLYGSLFLVRSLCVLFYYCLPQTTVWHFKLCQGGSFPSLSTSFSDLLSAGSPKGLPAAFQERLSTRNKAVD